MIYNDTKTVLFLGAGVSYCAGIPTQNKLLETIYSRKLLHNNSIVKKVFKFLNDYFNCNFKNKNFPTIEEVYSFLDFFISQNEKLNESYGVQQLKEISKFLTILISYEIDMSQIFKKTATDIYERFWEYLLNTNNKISIITTNYDSCLFESFDKFYPDSLLNYNVDFANYYEDYFNKMQPFYWWDDAKYIESKNVVNVYKLHGSLDWLYCSNCNKIMYTPFIRAKYNLDNGELKEPPLLTDMGFLNKIAKCPIDKCKYEMLIVPPSFNKNFSNSILKDLYFKSLFELRQADNIIFIGYSFPDADYHIKALLNRVNMNNKKVLVIDKELNNNKKRKYKSICKHINFQEIDFENCIETIKLFLKK